MSGNYPYLRKQNDQAKESSQSNQNTNRRPSASTFSTNSTSGGSHPRHQRYHQPAQFRICKPRSHTTTSPTSLSKMDTHQRSTSSSSPASSSGPGEYQPSQIGVRRAARNPALQNKLRQMALPLAPLVQVTTGQVHEFFPPTLLAFWLLTDAQLDTLASFYHQRDPCAWTLHYPCPIVWRPDMPIEEKRRKLGKFIGLRGCDTPIDEWRRLREEHGEQAELLRLHTEEEIMAAARRARDQAHQDEELFKRKMGWY